jgi:hypothetical protein
MKEHKTPLLSLLKRGWLYLRGLLYFGPARTRRSIKLVRSAIDAFEQHYGRLPEDDEKLRLVQKLSWFDQHYQRLPTPNEIARIVEQVEIH